MFVKSRFFIEPPLQYNIFKMLLSRLILYFPKNKKFEKSIDNYLILDYNVDTEKGREEKKDV